MRFAVDRHVFRSEPPDRKVFTDLRVRIAGLDPVCIIREISGIDCVRHCDFCCECLRHQVPVRIVVESCEIPGSPCARGNLGRCIHDLPPHLNCLCTCGRGQHHSRHNHERNQHVHSIIHSYTSIFIHPGRLPTRLSTQRGYMALHKFKFSQV